MNLHPKQVLIQDLAAWRKRQSFKVVATNGCFDILTAGHVECLQEAKKLGVVLIVGLNSDGSVRTLKGEGRPLNPVEDRLLVLAALECVDYVCIFQAAKAVSFLVEAKPHFYVKGSDYSLETLDPSEREVLEKNNTEIRFVPLRKCKSTSELIK